MSRTFPIILLLQLLLLVQVFGQVSRKAFEMLEEAESVYSDGKHSQALAMLDECLKQYPGYMDAYALRGNVKEALRDNEGALTDYSIYLDKF
ncbi:MAG TPA: hypothetical protein VGD31_04100, partial [Sphingobacteriaceae bacterium]